VDVFEYQYSSHGLGHNTDIEVKLFNADETTVLACRSIVAHEDWKEVLATSLSAWHQGTVDLLIATVGCVGVFPLHACSEAGQEVLRGPLLSIRRVHAMQYHLVRSDFMVNPLPCPWMPTHAIAMAMACTPKDDDIVPLACVVRGMLHVTPSVARQLTGDRCVATDGTAQMDLFAAIGVIVDNLHGNVRIVRIDAAVDVQASAVPFLCDLLRHRHIRCFQGHGVVFATCSTEMYTCIASACAHMHQVEFGSARVTVNVRPSSTARVTPIEPTDPDVLHSKVKAVRDASIMTRHLTDHERNQLPARSFLRPHAINLDQMGRPTCTDIWRKSPPLIH
jgi:hypothetical protein